MDYHPSVLRSVFVCSNGLSITTQCKCLSHATCLGTIATIISTLFYSIRFSKLPCTLFFYVGFTLIEQLFAPKTKIVKYKLDSSVYQ
jgi:hypothetical protein